jgi:hypothetical protein
VHVAKAGISTPKATVYVTHCNEALMGDIPLKNNNYTCRYEMHHEGHFITRPCANYI